jgi:two-component system KDP operon response regulator KdpE
MKIRSPSARVKTPPREGAVRVLIVADPRLGEVAALTLNHGEFEPHKVRTIEEARAAVGDWEPQLLVLDVGVGKDAMDLVGMSTREGVLPTIVLSERGDLRTKLEALDRGADDFIALPFAPEELIARAIAVLRRTYGTGIQFRPVIQVGDLEIDLLHNRVSIGPSRIRLTATELALLYLLASHPRQTLSRSTILDHVWGTEFVSDSNLIDRHVRNLRQKLKESWRKPRYIATVPGRGYRFIGS